MKLGFLYGGQGSQQVGMGLDLYESNPIARQAYDGLNLDFDIKEISFHGPLEKLSLTPYTQPCMVAFQGIVTDILKANGVIPDMVAGLSIGEYSALYAADVFQFDDLVQIARFRGLAMDRATGGKETMMVAVLGLELSIIEQICKDLSGDERVEVANLNCPGQTVVGGYSPLVKEAVEEFLKAGAKRCIPLNVSGPFHTSYMEQASIDLEGYLNKVSITAPDKPVITNVNGQIIDNQQDIKKLLVQQVKSPVYFEKSIRTMLDQGIDTLVEIGYGKVLAGFVKRISKKINVIEVNNMETIHQLMER